MKKIAITNAKGGVGKSTSAIEIADALTFMGYSVLFLDLDPQANSTSVFLERCEEGEAARTIYDVMEGSASIRDCTMITELGPVVPGDGRLAQLDAVYQTKIGGTKIIKNALKEVEDEYDFCIMDTPPNIGAFMRNALYAADGCICPVLPKKFSMDGLAQLLSTIGDIRDDGNEKLQIYGILLNVYDQRNSQDRAIREQLPEIGKALGIRVFDTVIRTCQDVEKSISNSRSLFRDYGSSNGAMDYAALVAELMEVI